MPWNAWNLIKQYKAFLSWILHVTTIQEHDHITWQLFSIRLYTNSLCCYWTRCRTQFYRIMRGFHRCCMPTVDAYSSGHLVPHYWRLACVLLLRPVFPKCVMSAYAISVWFEGSFQVFITLHLIKDHQGGFDTQYEYTCLVQILLILSNCVFIVVLHAFV